MPIFVAVLVGCYFLALLGIAWLATHPLRSPLFASPGFMGAPQEDVEFDSDGATLRGWWSEAPNAQSVAVLLHGYLMTRSELAPMAPWLVRRGVSCLVFDFRTHGKSGGKKTGLGITEAGDVAKAVEFARRKCPGAKIVLIGSSMGAAAGALAVGRQPSLADALILDSAYCRMTSAISGWWRFLGGVPLAVALWPVILLSPLFVGWSVFTAKISDSLRAMGPKPVLFVHGDRDNLALPSEAQMNFDAAVGPKRIEWMEGCGHSEGRFRYPDRFFAAVESFLRDHDFIA